MKPKIKFIVLLAGIIFSQGVVLSAQTIIKGKVVTKNNEPLAGAVVTLGVSTTETNKKGEFAVKSETAENTITVSSLGYTSQKINVDDASAEQTVQLAKNEEELDEVLVIGYGTSTRKRSTGNTSTITREVLEQYPGTSIIEVLQGRISGLTISKNTGVPGSNVSINIRGKNTINDGTNINHDCCYAGIPESTNSEPLIVIDGVPFINESISPLEIGAAGQIGPLAILSTSDIERIDVLKDSDATAIYGARGSNGVILITTKKDLQK
jgi:TonB-dependent SusC/RagA subfamily outer membrane receptor